jgi:hypothetical protein
MSFRARLTSFFVVIVVVPMLAVGVLVYSLISDSERAKAEARANGLITAAASLYANSAAAARDDAQTFAHDPALLVGGALAARVSTIVSRAGLARVAVTIGSRTVADVGDKTALAPVSRTCHWADRGRSRGSPSRSSPRPSTRACSPRRT